MVTTQNNGRKPLGERDDMLLTMKFVEAANLVSLIQGV